MAGHPEVADDHADLEPADGDAVSVDDDEHRITVALHRLHRLSEGGRGRNGDVAPRHDVRGHRGVAPEEALQARGLFPAPHPDDGPDGGEEVEGGDEAEEAVVLPGDDEVGAARCGEALEDLRQGRVGADGGDDLCHDRGDRDVGGLHGIRGVWGRGGIEVLGG